MCMYSHTRTHTLHVHCSSVYWSMTYTPNTVIKQREYRVPAHISLSTNTVSIEVEDADNVCL